MTSASQLLTSILATLREISQKTIEQRNIRPHGETTPESRYRRRPNTRKKDDLPEQARNILLTLHVLFPHVLLDALDLLDRGCVVRVLVEQHPATTATSDNNGDEEPTEYETIRPKRKRTSDEPENDSQTVHHTAHYVLSTRQQRNPYSKFPSTKDTRHPTHSRQSTEKDSTTNTNIEQVTQQLEEGQGYTVHTQAWNCSCPAFALAAYTNPTSPRYGIPMTNQAQQNLHEDESRRERSEWEGDRDGRTELPRFGGLSIPKFQTDTSNTDTRENETTQKVECVPPVCKHLLAVVLSEVAPGLFGPFPTPEVQDGEEDEGDRRGVWEVVVGVEAAAGLAAGMGSGR